MEKTITISDDTFDRLKQIAEPLVDNEDSVIRRILDYYDNGTAKLGHNTNCAVDPELILDPDTPEDLHHTRVLRATFSGQPVPPKWNELIKYAHRASIQQLGIDRTLEVSKAKVERGRRDDRGFKHVPDLGISIQGLDAPRSWDTTLWIARELKVPVEVLLEWHDKPEAIHPGKRALLKWEPKQG